jgi:hypothetical protein
VGKCARATFLIEFVYDYNNEWIYLQLILTTFNSICKLFHLKISTSKTEVMIINSQTPQLPIFWIENTQITVCNSFKYLGSFLTKDGCIDYEINQRISKAQAAFSTLFKRVWSRRNLSMKTKLTTYKVIILPTLLYAAETWHCKAKHFQKLEGFHYRCLRTIMRKKWSDFISYEEILENLTSYGINTIELMIRKSRVKKLQQILNMEDSRLLKIISHGEAKNGFRKPGRPKKSWREGVKEDLKIFDITLSQLKAAQHWTGDLEAKYILAESQKKRNLTQRRKTKKENLHK